MALPRLLLVLVRLGPPLSFSLAAGSLPSRLLKNYLRGLCGVKNGLKMLIYSSKLRFFGHFCLA